MGSMFLTEFKDFIINDLKVRGQFINKITYRDIPFGMSLVFVLISFCILNGIALADRFYSYLIITTILWGIYFTVICVAFHFERITVTLFSVGQRLQIAIWSTFFSAILFFLKTSYNNDIIMSAFGYSIVCFIPYFIILSLLLYFIINWVPGIKFLQQSCNIMNDNDMSFFLEIIVNDTKTIREFCGRLKTFVKDPAFFMSILLPFVLSFNRISDYKPKMTEYQHTLLSVYLWIIYFCVIYLGIYFKRISPAHLSLPKRLKIAFLYPFFYWIISDLNLMGSPFSYMIDLTILFKDCLVYALGYCIFYFIVFSVFVYVSMLVFTVFFKKPLKLPMNLLILLIFFIMIYVFYKVYFIVINYSNVYPPGMVRIG